ncbi:MAG TPA: hypothetical protein VFQ45_17705 [Longimicrobium sp.]|nr:hypothetical protein [Longimicrobium sp.]
MGEYPDAMALDRARDAFFARWGLGADGGYGGRWVRVETRPVPVWFPNTRCRVEAAKLHDLHHVATGYGADWAGEAEIAAWEIAGGCGRYGWAWLLNLGAFTVGMALCPRRLFRAFVRGRRARTLYHGGFDEARLSATRVGELRARLGITAADPHPTAGDRAAFAGWCIAAAAWHGGILAGGLMAAWIAWTIVS